MNDLCTCCQAGWRDAHAIEGQALTMIRGMLARLHHLRGRVSGAMGPADRMFDRMEDTTQKFPKREAADLPAGL